MRLGCPWVSRRTGVGVTISSLRGVPCSSRVHVARLSWLWVAILAVGLEAAGRAEPCLAVVHVVLVVLDVVLVVLVLFLVFCVSVHSLEPPLRACSHRCALGVDVKRVPDCLSVSLQSVCLGLRARLSFVYPVQRLFSVCLFVFGLFVCCVELLVICRSCSC